MERMLDKTGLSEKLKMSPALAAAELARRGVYPIDFGVGRGRGLRWLSSAVEHAMREMHEEAQPKKKLPRHKAKPPHLGLASLGVEDILALTSAPCVQ